MLRTASYPVRRVCQPPPGAHALPRKGSQAQRCRAGPTLCCAAPHRAPETARHLHGQHRAGSQPGTEGLDSSHIVCGQRCSLSALRPVKPHLHPGCCSSSGLPPPSCRGPLQASICQAELHMALVKDCMLATQGDCSNMMRMLEDQLTVLHLGWLLCQCESWVSPGLAVRRGRSSDAPAGDPAHRVLVGLCCVCSVTGSRLACPCPHLLGHCQALRCSRAGMGHCASCAASSVSCWSIWADFSLQAASRVSRT